MSNTKEIHNTIYDDVFRTIVEKMPELLIPVINEVFHTCYAENEKITVLHNEHYREDGKVITDSCLLIKNTCITSSAKAGRIPKWKFA